MQANAYEPSEALNASIGLATWCAWPQEGDGSTARTMVVWDADQLNRKVLEPLLKLVLQKTESIRKSAQHINYCQNKIQVQGNPENLNVDKVHESQSKQERRLKTDYETRLNFISEIKYAALTRWPPKDIDSYFIHVKNFTTYFKIFEAPGYEPAFEPEDAYDLRTAYQAIGNVEMPRDSKKLLELMEEVKSKLSNKDTGLAAEAVKLVHELEAIRDLLEEKKRLMDALQSIVEASLNDLPDDASPTDLLRMREMSLVVDWFAAIYEKRERYYSDVESLAQAV